MRKYLIAGIAAVVISFFIVIISMLSRSDALIPESSLKNQESVLNSVSLTAVNAQLDDDLNYTVTDGDAQLFIDGIEDEIGTLIVDFDEPLPYGTIYQLYYSKDQSGINERYSVMGRSLADSDKLAIRLPDAAYYDGFRLDIDADYTIEDIAIIGKDSDVNFAKSYFASVIKGRSAFPIQEYFITLFIILCEALLIAWKLETIKGIWKKARENQSILIRMFVTCVVCVVLGYVLWLLSYKMGIAHSSSKYTKFCYVFICLTVGLLWVFNRQIGVSPEKGFIIVALGIGLMFAVLEPASSYLSFDDEIHYSRALRLSYGNSSYITDVEMRVATRSASNQISLENKIAGSGYLNGLPFREEGGYYNTDKVPYYAAVSYLPAAGGIWLARILGLPFTGTFIAGRVCNLFCYCIVAYFAIKQLKYGKLFIGSLCLLPTILFFAGNYSYDAFCISFILLGICIWLGVYQRPESKMTGEKAAVMLIAFAVGILPKTVYFPVTLIALFLPKDRFASKASVKRYRWAVILTTALLMFSIVAPFLIGESSSEMFNDTRGGTNVNAKAQIQFILSDPMRYAGIFLKNTFTYYLSFPQMMAPVNGCIRATGYMDWQGMAFRETAAYAYLLVVFIAWLLSFDRYDNRQIGIPPWIKVMTFVLCSCAICVAVTSMYCGFTEVGNPIIGGFQERYMLPVLLPMLLVIRPTVYCGKEIDFSWVNTRVIYTEALVLFIGMWPFIQIYL